jgi:4'-phosphopantetheinyl transferase EntD
MPHFHLTRILSEPSDPAWQELAHSALGEKVHEERKRGFLLARQALMFCLNDFGLGLEIPQLRFRNFHELQNLPQFTISLSHTKEAGAALVSLVTEHRALGIDIEHEERPVKQMIMERISHPEDLKLRNIELWCLKEAVFKTLMNTDQFPEPVAFASLKIENGKWFHAPSQLEGTWELDVMNSFVVAKAFLT